MNNPKGITLKPLVGVALAAGDAILVHAMLYASKAHQLHGAALAVYVAVILASLALWAWVLRPKAAKPAARPYVPFGGGR